MSETNFLRPHQVESLKDDIRSAKATLADQHNQLDDRGAVQRRLKGLEAQLEKEEPPEINAQQRDRLVKMERDIRERVTEGMPSHEEMRRAPQGAIGKHRNWEKRNKAWVRRWKNIVLTLTKGSDDPEAASVERLRPHKSTIGMHSAIIGKDQDAYSFPSDQFQNNYDQINWDAHQPKDATSPRPTKADLFVDSMDGGVGRASDQLDDEVEADKVAAADEAARAAGAEIPDQLKAG